MRASFLSRSGCVLVCLLAASLSAGTFFTDFNSGLPENTAVFGDATVDAKDGVGGSGVLKLTTVRVNQMGSFVIQPLDGKNRVASFVATFKAHIGGGNGADGFAFHFASNIPDAPFADPGNNGLLVVFDTFKNGAQIAPGIRMQSRNGRKFEFSVPNLRNDGYVDVLIKLDPDGTLDLSYDNELIFTNLPTTVTNTTGRFAFGARTGSRTDNHFIDDLKIVTETSPSPFVDSFGPTGNDVSPSVMVDLLIRNARTKVKPETIKLQFDGEEVKPETSNHPDGTAVRFQPSVFYEPGSVHRVTLQFGDTGTADAVREFSYAFKITSQVLISK